MIIPDTFAVDSYAILIRVVVPDEKKDLVVLNEDLFHMSLPCSPVTVIVVNKEVMVLELITASYQLQLLLELIHFDSLYGIIHSLDFNFHNLKILNG